MTTLTQGANAPITNNNVRVAIDWPTSNGSIDATAYLLTAAGKVRGDQDMIFFNQPKDPLGSIEIVSSSNGMAVFQIDTNRMAAEIEKIVFCLTIETPGKTMAAFDGTSLAVTAGGNAISFAPDLKSAAEAALILAELYKRNGQWKIRAVAQGFVGGLAPLARSFGIEVDEPAAPAPSPIPPPPIAPPRAAPPPPPPPVAAPAAAPPRPVSLSKITLDKAKPSVSLEKRGSSFGDIAINLNWTSSGGTGFFGKPKPLDLDLGCLFELHDGFKGAVQALGNVFGSLHGEPYIQLDQDDRSGASAAGETLRINGHHWPKIRRIALFAFIYDGAANWRSTDGMVTITMPDQPPIEFAMRDGPNGLGFCGLALIENIGGTMKFTRIMEYFKSHKEYDERLGWGMRWKAGSK